MKPCSMRNIKELRGYFPYRDKTAIAALYTQSSIMTISVGDLRLALSGNGLRLLWTDTSTPFAQGTLYYKDRSAIGDAWGPTVNTGTIQGIAYEHSRVLWADYTGDNIIVKVDNSVYTVTDGSLFYLMSKSGSDYILDSHVYIPEIDLYREDGGLYTREDGLVLIANGNTYPNDRGYCIIFTRENVSQAFVRKTAGVIVDPSGDVNGNYFRIKYLANGKVFTYSANAGWLEYDIDLNMSLLSNPVPVYWYQAMSYNQTPSARPYTGLTFYANDSYFAAPQKDNESSYLVGTSSDAGSIVIANDIGTYGAAPLPIDFYTYDKI